MMYILKKKASEISQAPPKLYGKPLEANAATRLRALPSAFRDNSIIEILLISLI